MRHRILILVAIASALTLFEIRHARAQSTTQIPAPSNQYQPYIPPIRIAPNNGDEGNTIQLLPQYSNPAPQPPPPQPAAPPPAAMNVAPMTAQGPPALPSVFRGCWNGQVEQLDWIQREPGAPKIGFWTPKTYRLCYRRVGNEPFTLTFTETGVEPNDKIVNPHGTVVPISTDGRKFASMRSQLDFDEYKMRPDGMSPTFRVDEITNLSCRINGDDMLVDADVYGTRDAEPWFRAHWRADFRHFQD